MSDDEKTSGLNVTPSAEAVSVIVVMSAPEPDDSDTLIVILALNANPVPPVSLAQPGLQRSAVTGLGTTVTLNDDDPPRLGAEGEPPSPLLQAVDAASAATIEAMRNDFVKSTSRYGSRVRPRSERRSGCQCS
jgi:hypothetical protein